MTNKIIELINAKIEELTHRIEIQEDDEMIYYLSVRREELRMLIEDIEILEGGEV